MIKRLDWVDYLKTTGILAVILGHMTSPVGVFIFSWHMPLFFMLGGLFIKSEIPLSKFAVNNFKRLMIPYLIFSIIGVLVETIKRLALNRPALDYSYEMAGVFLWMDMDRLSNTYAFVLWFLPALFWSKIIVFLVLKINSWKNHIFIILALFYISFFVEIPFGLDNALNSILFVYLGYVYFKNHKHINRYIIYIVLIEPFYLLYSGGFPQLDLASKEYEIVVINIIWSVVFFICISYFFQIIKIPVVVNKPNNYWASNTMLAFIVHPYTNNFSYIVNEKILGGNGGWQFTFILSVTCLACLVAIKVFLEKTINLKKYV